MNREIFRVEQIPNRMPRVSVIMSVFNSENFLRESIESILDQSFRDFEFIIVNDASTDRSLEIIESYPDERIVVISNDENIGLTRSLNKALYAARGEYVARMDADDISLPERLERQVSFLDDHPEIGFCGTQVQYHGAKNPGYYPMDYESIKVSALSSNPFAHPTVVFRRELFLKSGLTYDEDFRYAQDYELWSRALFTTRGINLPERLLIYRVHSGQIGQQLNNKQNKYAMQIHLNMLKRLGVSPGKDELDLHYMVFGYGLKERGTVKDLRLAENWVNRLLALNRERQMFDDQEIINFWGRKVYGKGLYRYSLGVYWWSRSSITRRAKNIRLREKLSFLAKSVLGKTN